MKIVISIGGSIIAPGEPDAEYIKKFSELLRELSAGNKIGVVVGGGKIARDYIGISRDFGASEFFCDLLGIEVSRINARLLIPALQIKSIGVNKKPSLTIAGAAKEMSHHDVVVMGGTHPGHTTDGVAAMLSEYIDGDLLVIATSIDGVYTADPKKDPDAEKLEKLNFDELVEVSARGDLDAGASVVVDLVAAKVIKRSKIKTFVLDGRDLANFRNAVIGEKFVGSVVGD